MTQTQSFIKDKLEEHYAQRHLKLSDSGEAELKTMFYYIDSALFSEEIIQNTEK